MPTQPTSAGDVIPPTCKIIEVRVGELKQLFNEIDPSPFHDKDLDPAAEEFIVGWGRELPADAPLALLVHLGRSAGMADEPGVLGHAIHESFGRRALNSRRRLRELFRQGRISLAIAVAFLASCIFVGDFAADRVGGSPFGGILREGLLIGGWVAMWRPLQIFLYDWWPIRSEAHLYDRLAAMPVRIAYAAHAETAPAPPARTPAS